MPCLGLQCIEKANFRIFVYLLIYLFNEILLADLEAVDSVESVSETMLLSIMYIQRLISQNWIQDHSQKRLQHRIQKRLQSRIQKRLQSRIQKWLQLRI
jgi:hypothetical protein